MASILTFGSKTEADEVLAKFGDEVKNKTILITGVSPNSLGEALAMALAGYSPSLLILAGKDEKKLDTSIKSLNNIQPAVDIRHVVVDFASFSSIEKAGQKVCEYPEESIDIVFNSAGVMNIPERELSRDGFELHLAVNYLGPTLFNNLIMSKLLAAKAGRIVNLGSNGYVFSPFRFSDYNFDGNSIPSVEQPPKDLCESFGVQWGLGYLPTVAYGQSKTALLLSASQLAEKLAGKNVAVVTVHPGAIDTGLWRYMPQEAVAQIFTMLPMKSKNQGISTPLVAALDPALQVHSGTYMEDCQIVKVMDHANDKSCSARLWELSEQLWGKNFTW